MSEPIHPSKDLNVSYEPVKPASTLRLVPRLWPAVALVAFLWVFRFVLGRVELTTFERFMALMAGQGLVLLLFLVWWLSGRRIRMSWSERFAGLFMVIAINVICERLAHPLMHGMMWLIMVTPIVLTVWTIWWALTRSRSPMVRTGLLAAPIAMTCAVFAMLRMEGLSGEQHVALAWRWSPTREQVYLTELAKRRPATTTNSAGGAIVARPEDWPGFRGPQRDGVVRGLSIATDWSAHPPRQLWRLPVGPGWSSPVVVGERVFTQEQRGESEVIVCREARDGSEMWVHEDATRFEEGMSGAGPRATPLFADGKLYTLGAKGALNCLDAATGKPIWRADIAKDGEAQPPIWGFSSSPVIANGLVVVYAGGPRGLLAYRADSGKLQWSAACGPQSYTSPQLARFGGREEILFLGEGGIVGVDPASGKLLWEHAIPAPGAPRSIQPHVLSDSLVAVSSETDLGTALLEVTPSSDRWDVRRKWVSRALKPSFNDYVVQDHFAYGFDGAVFACVDLNDGKRKWREGRYGHGQVVLLEAQRLLLIVTEEGEVVLVRASPQQSEELGRFKAIEGKTWNHPAVARTKLVVRNGEEMECFELTPGK